MRKKVFYVYNPNTLSYERVYPSFRKRMATVFRHLLSGIILGGILFSVLNYFVDSPREKMLKRENQQMRSQYKLLSRRLDEALDVMADVRERDANLYRVILQADPISAAVWNAGTDNVSRYQDLMNLSDADLVVATTQKVEQLNRQLYVQTNSINELVKLGQQNEDRINCLPAIQPVSNKNFMRGWILPQISELRYMLRETVRLSRLVGNRGMEKRLSSIMGMDIKPVMLI